MPDGPLWIGEQEAADLLSLEDAIDVLAGAYRLQAGGAAATMRRAHLREGDAILHAVGGTLAGQGIAGTKTWTYTPGGAEPLIVLFSLDDGRVLGLVEAFALGQMRTAATSGLGTRVLARDDARTLALLGTGKQAFAQAQAMTCVRPLERIRLFGRDPERRAALAERLRATLAVDVSEHATVADAVAGADVITAITRSAEPILGGDLLEPGVHVNAVGAIVPARRELDAQAVGRADVIVVDSVDQARDDAGELRAAAEAGVLDWATVRGLDAVVDDTPDRARFPTDITLFKALGVGLSDVALGGEVLRRALAAGAGQLLPTIPVAHQ
ncbi:Alanine dehydrogenase [Baekduia alba]|uniref:ornithine cyclodeaminase family protein n=1 Tax=Baekduia alba TaxID=2997333 RepID=UPI002341BEE1|nr:ornithine cyclodeaminase family protein [Baekduia alba]WCB95314.1 Alanine dehydrogenase [Baekduia alba]